MTRVFVAGLMLIIGLAGARAEATYRWFTAGAMAGTVVTGVRNDRGSYFRIMCAAGAERPHPDLEYESAIGSVRKGDTMQVVVDGDAFQFDLDQGGLAQLDARGSRVELGRLVDKLTTSRAATFDVELPRLRKTERFSLKDARKALGVGRKALLADCGL